eukprot:244848_1
MSLNVLDLDINSLSVIFSFLSPLELRRIERTSTVIFNTLQQSIIYQSLDHLLIWNICRQNPPLSVSHFFKRYSGITNLSIESYDFNEFRKCFIDIINTQEHMD